MGSSETKLPTPNSQLPTPNFLSVVHLFQKDNDMGLFNAISGQLIDIIEWTTDSPDTMAWRFYKPDNEIKNGARLVVREGQVAALVSQGSWPTCSCRGRTRWRRRTCRCCRT